jgi:hypothetical protein
MHIKNVIGMNVLSKNIDLSVHEQTQISVQNQKKSATPSPSLERKQVLRMQEQTAQSRNI